MLVEHLWRPSIKSALYVYVSELCKAFISEEIQEVNQQQFSQYNQSHKKKIKLP